MEFGAERTVIAFGGRGPQEKLMKRVLAAVLAAAITAPVFAVPASAKSSVSHQRSPRLFNMAPQGKGSINSDDPSLTGGGSIGYNQNIYNW
jgi:hypothetical protein